MENDQITVSVIAISVEDKPEFSFFYMVDSGTTMSTYEGIVQCTVKVSHETFSRLLEGVSTFENEVSTGNIVISGDSQTLRSLGKLFRSST